MKTSISLAIVLLLCTLLLTAIPVAGEEGVYDHVIRLHILANSDSQEDQGNKLAIRDEILSIYGSSLTNCTTRKEAEATLLTLLPQMEKTAQEVLLSRGSCQTATVTLTEEWYPTREYDTFSLPAGNYLSLRILIGEAEGQNWWCVMYPPMCLGVATDSEIPLGLTEEEYELVSEHRYTIKFRVLEILKSIFA